MEEDNIISVEQVFEQFLRGFDRVYGSKIIDAVIAVDNQDELEQQHLENEPSFYELSIVFIGYLLGRGMAEEYTFNAKNNPFSIMSTVFKKINKEER